MVRQSRCQTDPAMTSPAEHRPSVDAIGVEYVTHKGSCHCGAVRFEADAPEAMTVYDCNCTICSRSGFLHLIIPADRFRLISGADYLTRYTFNTHTARHLFCRVCGIKSFYVPRSHPDGYSVNLRCIERSSIKEVTVKPFDGLNWEAVAR